VTITGLPPSITLHAYLDVLENHTEFSTGPAGSYTLSLDLTESHFIKILPTESTYELDGYHMYPEFDWDSGTRTYTLNQDVHQSIYLTGTDISLDGRGYSVNTTYEAAIWVSSGSDISINNIILRGQHEGLHANGVDNLTVENCDLAGYASSSLYNCDSATLRANNFGGLNMVTCYSATISNNVFGHTWIRASPDCHIFDNVFQGISAFGGDRTIIERNEFRAYSEVYLMHCAEMLFRENVGSLHLLLLSYAEQSAVEFNDFYFSSVVGVLYLEGSTGNTIRANTLDGIWGIALENSQQNSIYNNNFILRPDYWLWDTSSPGTQFYLDKPAGVNYWSAWTSPDANHDGYVDVPFHVGGNYYDEGPYAILDGWKAANPPPEVAILSPASGELYAVNTPISFVGSFTDNAWDTHTAEWTFDETPVPGEVDEGAGSVTVTQTFETAGVYAVSLTVTDQYGGSDSENTVAGMPAMVVIYDPNAGFVTGGGWINSPAGAYPASPSLTGKANFGFVSKYKKGATIPIGETEFRFNVADLDFHSTNYDWMVIGGPKAQYKGYGTVNDGGDYGFKLTAIDGAINGGGGVDKFRMKIWDRDTDNVVYDNQMDTADDYADPTTTLGGGSIVIHKAKETNTAGARHQVVEVPGGSTPNLPTEFRLYPNRPNPFATSTNIHFDLPQASRVEISIYDVVGRRVRNLINSNLPAGSHVIKWDRRDDSARRLSTGIYFYDLRIGGQVIGRKKAVVLG
jgi:parallel beta-helix repeat protein